MTYLALADALFPKPFEFMSCVHLAKSHCKVYQKGSAPFEMNVGNESSWTNLCLSDLKWKSRIFTAVVQSSNSLSLPICGEDGHLDEGPVSHSWDAPHAL